jgi:hypothetical protein
MRQRRKFTREFKVESVRLSSGDERQKGGQRERVKGGHLGAQKSPEGCRAVRRDALNWLGGRPGVRASRGKTSRSRLRA